MGVRRRTLFDAETAVVDTATKWISLQQYKRGSIHVFGLATGDEIVVEGTNEAGTPAQEQTLLTIGADGLFALSELSEITHRFRLRFSAADASPGDVTAILSGYIEVLA